MMQTRNCGAQILMETFASVNMSQALDYSMSGWGIVLGAPSNYRACHDLAEA